MESELIKPQPRLGFFGLLRESFKTLRKNGKLMLPILLLVILVLSQLAFSQSDLLEPVAQDLALQLVEHPKLFQDFGYSMHQSSVYTGALNIIRELLLVKLFILTVSSIIHILFMVAAVSSSSEAYTSKVQNLTEMIMKIRESWKKAILTSFYMVLLTIGSFFVYIICIALISILVVDSWASCLFDGVVFLLIMVLWIDVSALWLMSLVVSVLEDAGGLDAIERAGELMKGERVKASLLMVLFAVGYSVVHWVINAIISHCLEQWSRMVISVVLTNGLLCALKLFLFVVFTIFYHEQKEVFDQKAAKSLYLAVVGDEV